MIEITRNPKATDPGQRAVHEQSRQPRGKPIIPGGVFIIAVGAVVDEVKLLDRAFGHETSSELGKVVVVVAARSGRILVQAGGCATATR
jgi:hypothetical protein